MESNSSIEVIKHFVDAVQMYLCLCPLTMTISMAHMNIKPIALCIMSIPWQIY